jgi:hypothetical protein
VINAVRALTAQGIAFNCSVNTTNPKTTPCRALDAKPALAEPFHRLIELMQRLNFGRIEGLQIRAGEPVFDPPPRLVRKVKMGGENGPRQELSTDFPLKKPFVELISVLSGMNEGIVLAIDVKHGLPFAAEIELAASVMNCVATGK